MFNSIEYADAHLCGCLTSQNLFVQRCPEAERLWQVFSDLVVDAKSTKTQLAEAANTARTHAGLTPVSPEGFIAPD